jgi:gliding motility-associated protein GldC
MAALHTSEIKLTVSMDENRVPEALTWDASDGGVENEAAKAFILSVWDKKTGDTLTIDLWTKDMLLDDMKRFFHQTFLSMADSFERATDEEAMAADMRDFAHHFADKMKLISTSSS